MQNILEKWFKSLEEEVRAEYQKQLSSFEEIPNFLFFKRRFLDKEGEVKFSGRSKSPSRMEVFIRNLTQDYVIYTMNSENFSRLLPSEIYVRSRKEFDTLYTIR